MFLFMEQFIKKLEINFEILLFKLPKKHLFDSRKFFIHRYSFRNARV